jgi:ABC-type nitrate/sulfonate/bicarbonate transport system substrate-binding protein
MNLGLSSPARGTFSFPLWPGLQRRLADQGSQLATEAFSGHTPTAGALVRNNIVAGYMGLPSILAAQAEGLPLVAIHSFMHEYFFPMVTQPDITEWSQLEGATIAAHAPTGASATILKYMVRQELGSMDSIEVTYIIGSGNRGAALQSGDVDATVILDSVAEQLAVSGDANILAYPWDYEGLTGLFTNAWVALEPALEDNATALQTFVDEMQASYARMFEGDHDTIIAEAKETGEYPNYADEAWAQSLDQATSTPLWPETKDQALPASNIEKTMDLLVEVDELEEDARRPVEDIVDRRFLE